MFQFPFPLPFPIPSPSRPPLEERYDEEEGGVLPIKCPSLFRLPPPLPPSQRLRLFLLSKDWPPCLAMAMAVAAGPCSGADEGSFAGAKAVVAVAVADAAAKGE